MDSEPEKNREPEATDPGGVDEIDHLNALAWELACKEDIASLELAERALQLARSAEYHKGAALALRTLAHMDSWHHDYAAAFSHLLEAMELLETLDAPEVLLDVMADLGWVYFNLGDFPRAVEVLLKGLKFARESSLPDPEVNILCSLGAVYAESGDLPSSLEVLQRAADYKKDSGVDRLHSIALNNLAMTYLDMQQYDQAMDCADQALDITRQIGSEELKATCLDTIGQIALARKEYARAENFIKESIALNQRRGVNDEEIWLSLGRVYVEQNRMDEAASVLGGALESVQKKGTRRIAFLFHELLSKVYEARGDYFQALEQYRLYHQSMSHMFSEDTQRKLDNMIILHKVETSRIDSQIYRLRNQTLEREISARRMDVARMEVLATTDALTGLFNRRHFLTLGGYLLEEAHKTSSPLIALWMDIDNFKQVNARHGHLTGDEVLTEVSQVIQTSLRSGDLLSRFGGEEFAALLPATSLAEAQWVAERILKNTAAHIVWVENRDIQVTLSIGVAQAAAAEDDLETLLHRADQAQYAAKRAGKNRVFVDWVGAEQAGDRV